MAVEAQDTIEAAVAKVLQNRKKATLRKKDTKSSWPYSLDDSFHSEFEIHTFSASGKYICREEMPELLEHMPEYFFIFFSKEGFSLHMRGLLRSLCLSIKRSRTYFWGLEGG